MNFFYVNIFINNYVLMNFPILNKVNYFTKPVREIAESMLFVILRELMARIRILARKEAAKHQ